ncbi:DDX24 [Symbiodinium microadriaticum]|nr:DDX24 [Symbiodinium microadriaticum]
MEASGDGSEERGRDPAAEPVAPGVQLDQAELEVEARGTGEQLRMVEDEVLEPPYGEPELVEPNPADVSPGPAEGARPGADEGEPRGEETLASLRHPEVVSAAPVEESPESWGHSDSRQSEESSRLQQLTSVLETLVQGQQALNNRLERVEEVRSSHSWRSAESSQGLGWVDQTALDRWYTEATARAAASGHRDANMYIAGRLDGGRRDLRSEAQALQDRVAQQRFEAQASHDRAAQQRSEAQALQDRAAQQRSEAQALQDRAAQQRSEAQVLQDRAAPQRSEAQGVSRKRGAEEVKIAGGGSESSAAVSTATKTTLSVGGDSSATEELVGATVAPTSQPTLPPGTKLQVRIDGQLRDVVVNENGGLEPSRHITELPTLAEPRQRSQGAVLAGDWLAAVAPLMRQLSSSAQTWWAQNLKEAEDHYERWLRATPQQRLQVKASAMAKSFDAGKYCLVEQRGVQLLLKAVPDSFRTDLIATRTLAVNAIVFAILCRWQPGGKLERAQVLDYLVHPEASGSVEETVEGIRKWRRMVLRASELGAVLPDSSLLLKGLDSLTQPGLGEHPVVSFRVAAYRNESGVDFAPTQAKVAELAEYLLAEYEALSIQEDPRAQGPKRPRAATAKAAAAKVEAKAPTDRETTDGEPPHEPAAVPQEPVETTDAGGDGEQSDQKEYDALLQMLRDQLRAEPATSAEATQAPAPAVSDLDSQGRETAPLSKEEQARILDLFEARRLAEKAAGRHRKRSLAKKREKAERKLDRDYIKNEIHSAFQAQHDPGVRYYNSVAIRVHKGEKAVDAKTIEQVQSHLNAAAAATNLRTECLVGGMSTQKQKRLLKRRPGIVVGTPGRIYALLGMGEEADKCEWLRAGLKCLRHLVLDEEFSKLVKSPKLKFWMSQLELEYHDLLSLFEFLDNGDGEITLTEFIEGAARLRGGAKALDIWRMETKLEVLFEEVLTILNFIKGGAMVPNDPSISVVQDVFNNSLFKHIQSTARGRQRSAE